jgi:hypothetical protein
MILEAGPSMTSARLFLEDGIVLGMRKVTPAAPPSMVRFERR